MKRPRRAVNRLSELEREIIAALGDEQRWIDATTQERGLTEEEKRGAAALLRLADQIRSRNQMKR